MTTDEDLKADEERLAFYMDLLGHDVLNSNQAVLGYLELILATPGTDATSRKFAEKAVSHIKTSTMLTENMKRLLSTRAMQPSAFKPVDIVRSLLFSERELGRFFPGKKIKLRIVPKVDEAFVMGNSAAQDLLMNIMVNLVRLDPSDEVEVTVRLKEKECGGRICWRISIEDRKAELPAALRGRDIDSLYREDSSTAVKLTGMIFAKMIADSLEGDFEADEIADEAGHKGTAFTLTLRKAKKP